MPPKARQSAAFVIAGDEEYQKARALQRTLDTLLPPDVDRAMALAEYDGGRPETDGGPSLAAVMDDLNTLPFLADRRVVLIREADTFVTAHRERLEKVLAEPPPSGTLVLVCRSFPKTTRLYKAVAAVGEVVDCKKLNPRGLTDFAIAEARALDKRLDFAAAGRLVNLVGVDQGSIANEVEKLALYVGERPAIHEDDVIELVGLSREEKIFAVMDAAGAGRLPQALALWRQTLASDPGAEYKALGGVAFVLRRWIAAHHALATGESVHALAPKLGMWNRGQELAQLLQRLPQHRLKRNLATIAELDSQVKVGARSIESGVEALLIELASNAA